GAAGPSQQRPEPAGVLPSVRPAAARACPPGRSPAAVDERLVLYEDWELEACVDAALLDAQMDRVSLMPFTYQQLRVFKCKLDELHPQGYPETLVRRLGSFFLEVTPEDVHKWNVTSLETVMSLLRASEGRKVDAQVAALIVRYVAGGGQLDHATLTALAAVCPASLCALSPQQLRSVPPSVLWAVQPADLDACRPPQMDALYRVARAALGNLSGSERLSRIKPFLGGAPSEDLRALAGQNLTLDVATFKKLQLEAVLSLTVSEVQRLLGPNVLGLKAEQHSSPVRDWLLRQPQGQLDRLGLGLLGGIPNGYLVLDLRRQEALARGPHLLGPGPALALTPILLLAGTLN
ncbi:mesothelin-like, partial [Talpa occidentalis]|uniref:mesothelin-like n=1 Tax=Talpa occidentalis TaxID=50954 RepID=UPI0023F92FE6